MNVPVSDYARDLLLRAGLGEVIEDNPFAKDPNGQAHIRYDSIAILGDRDGIELHLRWHGITMVCIRGRDVDLRRGDTLVIEQLSGWTPFNLTS